MTLRVLAVVVAVASLAAVAAPKKGKGSQENPNFVKAPTQAQYLAIAQKAFDESFEPGEALVTATNAVAEWKKQMRDALGMTSNAAWLIAFGKTDGVPMVAAAALEKPDDPLIATTLGVALSHIGHKHDALKVQLYAEQLAPRMPLVLTNLGTVYADLGATGLAFIKLHQVTTIAPDFCPGWNALAMVYANEGNARKGVEAYLHAMPCSTMKHRKQQMRQQRREDLEEEKKKVKSGGSPGGVDPLGAEAGSGGGTSLGGDIFFRPFPQWSTVEAFIAASDGFKDWKNELARLRDEATAEMKPDLLMAAYNRRQQLRAQQPGTVVLEPSDDITFALDDVWATTELRLEALNRDHLKETNAIEKKMADTIKQSMQRFETIDLEPLRELNKQPLDETRNRHNAHCTVAMSAVGAAFVEWRDSEKRTYDRTTELLRSYWHQTRPWLSQLSDDGERSFYQAAAELRIWSRLGVFPATLPTRALMYQMSMVSPVAKCTQAPVPPPPPPPKEKEQRPPKMRPNCPVPKGQAVSVGGVAGGTPGNTFSCNATLTGCEQVSVECSKDMVGPFGVKGGASYNMEDKELTLSGGVYLGAGAEKGPLKSSFSFSNTFDVAVRNGHVTRVGFTVGTSGSTGVQAGGLGAEVTPPIKTWGDQMQFTIWDAPKEKPLKPGELKTFELPKNTR